MHDMLLSRLPSESTGVIQPYLLPVRLAHGIESHEGPDAAQLLAVPTSAVLAIEHESVSGHVTVVGLIDRHGMTGLRAVLGHTSGLTRLRVVVSGDALQQRCRRADVVRLPGALARGAAPRQSRFIPTGRAQARPARTAPRDRPPRPPAPTRAWWRSIGHDGHAMGALHGDTPSPTPMRSPP